MCQKCDDENHTTPLLKKHKRVSAHSSSGFAVGQHIPAAKVFKNLSTLSVAELKDSRSLGVSGRWPLLKKRRKIGRGSRLGRPAHASTADELSDPLQPSGLPHLAELADGAQCL